MEETKRVKSSHSLVAKVITIEGQDSAIGSIALSKLRPPFKRVVSPISSNRDEQKTLEMAPLQLRFELFEGKASALEREREGRWQGHRKSERTLLAEVRDYDKTRSTSPVLSFLSLFYWMICGRPFECQCSSQWGFTMSRK